MGDSATLEETHLLIQRLVSTLMKQGTLTGVTYRATRHAVLYITAGDTKWEITVKEVTNA